MRAANHERIRTLYRFLKLSTSGGNGIITNHLVDAQKQRLNAARRAAFMRAHPRSVLDPRVEYGFRLADPAAQAKYAITRSLSVYVVGIPALNKLILTSENLSELAT
ncbi:hypothetical protein Plhal710r2_c010g0046291 [Plasmopara halstedii]